MYRRWIKAAGLIRSMTSQATLNSPAMSATSPPWLERVRAITIVATAACSLAALAMAAWAVRSGGLYTSGKGLGYALGLIGGSLMLGLLLYPLRKRLHFMHEWGALKHWFRFHMVGGVLGPVLVLFHSTFHIGSFNAAVALACMLLVVASGLVGRFIYRKIHHGLYGSQASLKELEQTLAQECASLAPVLSRMPLVNQEVERFATLVSHRPAGRYERALHFLSLGAKRMLAGRRLRRALAAYAAAETDPLVASHANLKALLQTIDSALQAVQRRAQFSTYERLFSLWHVIHIPFLCMLVITALVHVVAVHVY
jgi:hypothetical protein